LKTLEYIEKRKKEIHDMLAIDRQINAENYDDIARLKEVEKIEKVLKKELAEKGIPYGLHTEVKL